MCVRGWGYTFFFVVYYEQKIFFDYQSTFHRGKLLQTVNRDHLLHRLEDIRQRPHYYLNQFVEIRNQLERYVRDLEQRL